MKEHFFYKYSLKQSVKIVLLMLLLVNIGVLPEILKFNEVLSGYSVGQVFDCETSETPGTGGDCEKDLSEDIPDFLIYHTNSESMDFSSFAFNLYLKTVEFISFDGLDVNCPPPENGLA